MDDQTAFGGTIGTTWTLLADFSVNRVEYFHLMLLTPVGDRVEFSLNGGAATHIISRAEDSSLIFDNRPIRSKLWAKSDNALGSDVAVNIW